ncbi:MAG: hypothetical protein AB8G17_13810 [Gammaproteobacteria bacterium]
MKPSHIRYRFQLPAGTETAFDLHLDETTAELHKTAHENPPDWAKLEFNQCRNCPLKPDAHPLCPVAHSLLDIVPQFEGLVSYDQLTVVVETESRTVTARTDAQTALSSLIGLVMASSGCPHTRFFRPMARFHLPLASEQETTHRAVTNWLLAQHFKQRRGEPADTGLDGLVAVYEQLQTVNAALTARLRAAGRTDSTLNAVVLLDLFAMIVPAAIDDSLAQIQGLLEPFLDQSVAAANEHTCLA